MSLAEEIVAKSKEIHTDGYPMSLGELANLYKDKELRLHPEFQRQFRWTDKQKSNLIESILLGIPLPPIFVVQEKDSVWDVIDGLQRLSTIFEFMGILRNENDELVKPSILQKTKFLPSLENKKWEDKELGDCDDTLTQDQRIAFKRSKINISIITKNSDSDAKFELFQRLNTGGSSLTAQEIRNCLMIMHDRTFYDFIRELADDNNFKNVLSLSERQLEEKYDMELICRYISGCYSEIDEFRNLADISDFINEKMICFATNKTFDKAKVKSDFKKLFVLLGKLDFHPFAKYNQDKNVFAGMFLISAFEVIAMGLNKNLDSYSESDENIIVEKIKSIWSDDEFLSSTGSGKSAKTRMAICVEIGTRIFAR